MIGLKDGLVVEDARLDRVPSRTTEHLEKFPLTADTKPDEPTSMVAGFNWYSNFDNPIPTKIRGVRRYVIGHGSLGRIRGGHAVCLRHWDLVDLKSWWLYYNQAFEGRCVEFAKLRAMSQKNRKRYDITSRWHYHTDQHRDEWAGCFLGHDGGRYEGTSVRSGLEGLRVDGAIPARLKGAPIAMDEAVNKVDPNEGISVYRWAPSWGDVRTVLNVPDYLPGVPLDNSWGQNYPHEVILLDEAGERLMRENGEFGIITDK